MHNYPLKLFAKLSVWVLLLLGYSCARIPEHELACISDVSGCTTIVEEAVNSGQFHRGDWPAQEWWKDFEDPILTGLIEDALRLSPTLKRAEARLKAAFQVALQKKATLFPEVDLDASTNWQHLSKEGFYRAIAPTIPAVVNDIYLGLSFSYELDLWGKNRKLYEAALGQTAAFAAERKQAELILTTSIAYTYAQLQFLLQKRAIIQQVEENNEGITLARIKRERHAIDTTIERLHSETDTLDVRGSLVELEDQIRAEIHKLKALTGLGQDAVLKIDLRNLKPLRIALPENLALDLIGRRPDLIAQRARVEAASKQIGAAKTDFYPNINLTGFVGLESIFWNSIFLTNNYSGNIMPAIHLPIFTAGRLRAHLMEKVEDFNEAVFSYDELILRAAQDVANALTAISLLQLQIDVRKISLQKAEQEANITLLRFKHALDDQISLYKVKNQVLQMELILAGLEYGKQLAGIQLIRALGGGFYER
jgi:NodT family efflux transporter outer membrane factor (OMF) lipoprotein